MPFGVVTFPVRLIVIETLTRETPSTPGVLAFVGSELISAPFSEIAEMDLKVMFRISGGIGPIDDTNSGSPAPQNPNYKQSVRKP